MTRARSNYRQVRATITEEHGGLLTARVMVKPVTESWTFRHTVWVHTWRRDEPTQHWLDLLAEAVESITRETLPPPR